MSDTAVIVRMPAEMHSALMAAVRRDDRSMAQTIRMLVRGYLAVQKDSDDD